MSQSPPASVDVFGAGALTDIGGIEVGHHQRVGRGWQTGTTVVLIGGGAVAAVDVRGGGPGTRETDALDPRNLVDRVHAVCLTGGSAYGLAAADGVMAVLEQRRLGVRVGTQPDHVVPVVPAAVIFDLGRGGRFDHRPTAEFGATATRRARAAGVARGSVGAGTGARAGGMQGGLGMASVRFEIGGRAVVVAALAVVNAAGSPIDPATAAPWSSPAALRRPTGPERTAWAAWFATAQEPPPLNTTIGVVATDADLARAEVARLAQSAHDGLARAVRPAHSIFDGDTVFGLATCGVPLPAAGPTAILRDVASRAGAIHRLCEAAADVFERACVDAVVTATSVGDAPAYRDLCPSAFRVVDAAHS